MCQSFYYEESYFLYHFSSNRFFSILLTYEGSQREVYRDFQPCLASSADGAKGWSDHRFRAPPAYTAQLLTIATQSQQPA